MNVAVSGAASNNGLSSEANGSLAKIVTIGPCASSTTLIWTGSDRVDVPMRSVATAVNE